MGIIMGEFVKNINRILVVGAGTMGHSIAQVFAQHGYEVDLIDVNKERLKKALNLIKSNLNVLSEFNKVNFDEITDIINRIHVSTDLTSVAPNADLAIEVVNEVPSIKKEVFMKLNESCKKDIILVSNTSGLNIFEIAEIDNPERLIIHHWFAPPHIIPLVEVVKGPNTSEEVVKFSVDLLNSLGKKPIVLNQFVDNFIVNRIQNVISVQVYEMIAKGWATPEQIDLAIKTSLGIRLPIVGVVQTQDFTGLDLILDIQKRYRMNKRFPQIEQLVNQGRLGAKTGKGWYDYRGKTEQEILMKRDQKYLKMLKLLENIEAFEPI